MSSLKAVHMTTKSTKTSLRIILSANSGLQYFYFSQKSILFLEHHFAENQLISKFILVKLNKSIYSDCFIWFRLEIEEVPGSVRFNIHDACSIFYNLEDGHLYLSFSRCGCDTCITSNFLNCTVTKHHIHKFSMSSIKLTKLFPHPSPSNGIKTEVQDDSIQSQSKKLPKLRPRKRKADYVDVSSKNIKSQALDTKLKSSRANIDRSVRTLP